MGSKTHGMSGTRLYMIWKNMKQRCYNPNVSRFKYYGGVGVEVCKEWQNFVPFMEWSYENGYEEHLVIDRVDYKGNYEPSNCQWVTSEENSVKAVEYKMSKVGKEMKGNINLTYKGRTQNIREWARELEMDYQTLLARIYTLNWDVERALTQPVKREITYQGVTKPITEWEKEVGIPYENIDSRLRNGWSVERTLTEPVKKYNLKHKSS